MDSIKKVRQSNFELLRIVAMIFIVTHHLIIKGADTCGYLTTYDLKKDGCLGLFINGLAIVGVFVIHFALLVLVAPILEVALKGKDERTVGKWVILLLIVNVFFGFLLGYVNDNGYNYSNFILLYVIARYIRLIEEKPTRLYNHIQKFGILYWILAAILLTVGFVILYKIGKVPSSTRYFAYNNPLVLFSAFCIFIVFSSLKFKSKWVNIIAAGMFGVFLMHTPPEIIPLRNKISSLIFLQYGYLGIFAEVFILFTALTIIAIPTEKLNSFISKTLQNRFKILA